MYAMRTAGVHHAYAFCWILEFGLQFLGHLLGLNAWALVGIFEYECFGQSEGLYLMIRPKKELGPIWKIRPIMGLE